MGGDGYGRLSDLCMDCVIETYALIYFQWIELSDNRSLIVLLLLTVACYNIVVRRRQTLLAPDSVHTGAWSYISLYISVVLSVMCY